MGELQSTKDFRHMKIGTCYLRRLPSGIESVWPLAFDAEQVQSPVLIAIKVLCEELERDNQVRNANVFLTGDLRLGLHVTHQIRAACWRNIQVEPVAVGADLKFFVVLAFVVVGLKKDLGDITKKELLMALVGLRVDIDVLIMGFKAQVEELRRPQHPNFCRSLRIALLSTPIRAEDNWQRPSPVAVIRKCLCVQWTANLRCNYLARALPTI